MKKRKVVGALLGAVGAVALAVTPAQAEPEWPANEVENDAGSQGMFQADGDYIGTLDWAFDGKSAITYWQTDYGRTGACVDSDGAQNGVTACNYDMAESGYISYQVCHKDLSGGGTRTECSNWSEWISIRDGIPY